MEGYAEAFRAAREWVRRQYPELGRSEDPLIYLWMVPELSGLTESGVRQWKRRSRIGYTGPDAITDPAKRFPAPYMPAITGSRGTRRTRPQWHLSSIIAALVATKRWHGTPDQRQAA